MHRPRTVSAVALLFGLLVSACASNVPPARMADYVGPSGSIGTSQPLPDWGVTKAGLVLVMDTSAPDAAPRLPDQALEQMGERLQAEFNRLLPVVVTKVLPADGIKPDGDLAKLCDVGKKEGLDALVVVVASATEVEYPIQVAVMWTTHVVPGLRRDNWSLVEAALIDVRTGHVLIQAEGRGWATLDRPTVPDVNLWYPVIWKRPLDPNWRWWPPTFESAPHTLRVIAMQEAVKRLTPNLLQAWTNKRTAEVAALGQ